ncbi:hypothetical protein OKE68_10480, partial [Riemerella anatipestifer]
YNYVDNIIDIEAENIQEEQQRIVEFINNAQNIEQLQEAEPFIEENSEVKELYDKKLKDLTK